MVHMWLELLLIAATVWIFKQIPGFNPPAPPPLLVVILVILLLVLAWVLVGTPAISLPHVS